MKKISNKFNQRTLTTVIVIIIFWNISSNSGISLKLEKKNSFNPFSDDRNQFQCQNIVLNNRSASLFLNFNC